MIFVVEAHASLDGSAVLLMKSDFRWTYLASIVCIYIYIYIYIHYTSSTVVDIFIFAVHNVSYNMSVSPQFYFVFCDCFVCGRIVQQKYFKYIVICWSKL